MCGAYQTDTYLPMYTASHTKTRILSILNIITYNPIRDAKWFIPNGQVLNSFFSALIASRFYSMSRQPSRPWPPHYWRFRITARHTTLVESSGRVTRPSQRPLTDNTHNSQTSMPQAGFKPAIPASERQQIHSLDRTATEIGKISLWTTGI